MIKIWFKIFFRNSKKNWLNVLVNISGLTLGLAGLLIVLLYFQEEESYNQWNPNKDTIYRVDNKSRNNGVYHVATSGEAYFFNSDIPEVEQSILIGSHFRSRMLSLGDKKVFTKKVIFTEPAFFDFFPFTIIEGSATRFAESRNQIALSKALSEKIFGARNGVGKLLKIGELDYVVACVYTIPGNSHYTPELLLQNSKPFDIAWGNYNNELFCKLSEGADITAVKQKMDAILIEKVVKPWAKQAGRTLEELEEKYGFTEVLLEPLSAIYLHNQADGSGASGEGNYSLLLVLLGLSILLIVISCVNFINLSTASASQRAKEVGVKKTLGLSKNVLVFQYVLEVVIQGIIALVFALILVELILPYFNEFIGKELTILSFSSLYKVILVALITSLFIGSIPALYLSNFKTIEVLKGNFSRSKKGIIIRNVMLAFQFLISGFFFIGVLIIYAQMNFMINKDLGFTKEQIIVVDVYRMNDKYKKYQLVKEALSAREHITDVSLSMFVPGEGNVNGTSLRNKEYTFSSGSNVVDFNYLDFADIKILKGRSLSEKYASDTINSIVVNETAAKRLGIYDNPIGQKTTIGWMEDDDKRQLEIVGMIKDYHIDGFDVAIDPLFLIHWNTFPFSKEWIHAIQFKIEPAEMSQTIANIEKFWKENVDDEYPFSYEFLDQKFAKTYAKYEKQQSMFLVLSIIVIIISLLGLFALATLTIQQRLKEVAIRKTLGASVGEIMKQLIKSFFKIVLLASVVLIPVAYYMMQQWLENFVYSIEMPIWPYIVTPIVLLLLVFAVVGVKAYSATKIDLIKYLKFE